MNVFGYWACHSCHHLNCPMGPGHTQLVNDRPGILTPTPGLGGHPPRVDQVGLTFHSGTGGTASSDSQWPARCICVPTSWRPVASRASIQIQPLEEAPVQESQLSPHPAPASLFPGPPALTVDCQTTWYLGALPPCVPCGPWDTGTAHCVYATLSLRRARVNLPMQKMESPSERASPV